MLILEIDESHFICFAHFGQQESHCNCLIHAVWSNDGRAFETLYEVQKNGTWARTGMASGIGGFISGHSLRVGSAMLLRKLGLRLLICKLPGGGVTLRYLYVIPVPNSQNKCYWAVQIWQVKGGREDFYGFYW